MNKNFPHARTKYTATNLIKTIPILHKKMSNDIPKNK